MHWFLFAFDSLSACNRFRSFDIFLCVVSINFQIRTLMYALHTIAFSTCTQPHTLTALSDLLIPAVVGVAPTSLLARMNGDARALASTCNL